MSRHTTLAVKKVTRLYHTRNAEEVQDSLEYRKFLIEHEDGSITLLEAFRDQYLDEAGNRWFDASDQVPNQERYWETFRTRLLPEEAALMRRALRVD